MSPLQNKKGVSGFFDEDFYAKQYLPVAADAYYEKLYNSVEYLNWSGLVLDAGCGRGGFIRAMKRHGIGSIVGTDISNESLVQAKDTNAMFVTADLESLPFKDETFDVIFTAGVLYYFPNLVNPLQELIRVLKSGGRFIAIEPNASVFIKLSTRARKILAKFINLEILKSVDKTVHSGKNYRTVFEDNYFIDVQIVHFDILVHTLKEHLLGFLRHPRNLSYLILIGRRLLEKFFKVLPRSQSCNNIKIIATKGDSK